MEIQTKLIDLPPAVHSFVHRDDDCITIVINARLSAEDRTRHYLHELKHIHDCDFEKDISADEIEFAAHKNPQD